VLVKPVIVLLCVTVISLITLNMMFHDKYKSAVIFSITIFLIFLFGPFFSFVEKIDLKFFRFRYFIIIYTFIFLVVLLFFLFNKHINSRKVSRFLNLAGLAVLSVIIINLSISTLSVLYNIKHDVPEKEQDIFYGFKNHNQSSSNIHLPDIYYIVLDSYPNQECMADILNFNNEDFTNRLKSKGFFITKSSRSNYNFTLFSIPATLNLNYLSMKKIENGIYMFKKNENFYNRLKKRIENSRLVSYLESMGYNKYLDTPVIDKKFLFIEFNIKLLYMTILVSPYLSNYVSTFLMREYAILNLKSWINYEDIKKPIFYFKHIIIPHVPYMFDRYGNIPDFFSSNVERLFIEQLLYTNMHAEKIIDNILSHYKEKKPIIIIQGDHGPDIIIKDKERRMKIRTSILNAVYLPDMKENIFYDGMTSVNTFRILLNKYFGTNLELLPDITYYQEVERDRLVVYNPK